ncbi:enoyl-CoA hydratase/isomerase family protein [Candidatus Entotheonella palauensis]|uniref:enoyl-CoA hydratase/isomerase family protein n=1 Tax=Candidatus Entotheonella palauensis TaxID=93172 RepID=UPI000B7EE8CF|nr:enoyl-CoA hydratase-related protein [Candidatus Entotheonella palauensis]
MPDSYVRYEVQDHVATLTMDRPPVNALDFKLMDDILAALRRAGDDPEVRAVVVNSAAESAFCAGLDLKAVQAWPPSEVKRFLEKIYIELYDVQNGLGKPSVAAVRGAARGGGISIAISCDMIVAGETSSFSYSEIHVGLIPAIHLIHLPRLVGRYRAFDLLFNGPAFGAKEAMDIGIVSRVVIDADVDATAWSVARQLAGRSPSAMRIGREMFKLVNDHGFRNQLPHVINAFAKLSETEDAQEGFRAFVEKRPPQWPGR